MFALRGPRQCRLGPARYARNEVEERQALDSWYKQGSWRRSREPLRRAMDLRVTDGGRVFRAGPFKGTESTGTRGAILTHKTGKIRCWPARQVIIPPPEDHA